MSHIKYVEDFNLTMSALVKTGSIELKIFTVDPYETCTTVFPFTHS